MLALSALHHFDNQDISKLAEYYEKLGFEKNAPFGAKFRASESFNRFKKALNKSPQEWVGWNNDPSNPEYQKVRQAANRLLSKITGGAPVKRGPVSLLVYNLCVLVGKSRGSPNTTFANKGAN